MKYVAVIRIDGLDNNKRREKQLSEILMKRFTKLYNDAIERINSELENWNSEFEKLNSYTYEDEQYNWYIADKQDEILKTYDDDMLGLKLRSNRDTCGIEGIYDQEKYKVRIWIDVAG